MRFQIAGPGDEAALAELFAHIDTTFFRPHDFTPAMAAEIAGRSGRDLFALLFDGDMPVAYGLLRGWDEGYETPSLGIAVRTGLFGRGIGRRMMRELHRAAAERGSSAVRLRVHEDNVRARRLYERLGYVYAGEERGELVMNLSLPRISPGGVRLLHPDDPDWDIAIAAAHPSVFHSSGYHRYSAGFDNAEPYLAVLSDETGGLAWPYLLRDVEQVPGLHKTDRMDVTSAYGYPGPLVWGWGDERIAQALDRIAETWRRQQVVSVFTRFNPLLGNDATIPLSPAWAAPGSRGVVAAGATVSVDLTEDADLIRARYRRDLRRQIRRCREAGLETVEDTTWASLPAFALQYRETMERLGAADFYYFSLADFERLRRSLPHAAHLLITRRGDVVAAAGLFLESGDTVEWHLVSTNSDLLHLSPAKVLVDDTITWAKRRGFKAMHLGGGLAGREDSLFWFKSGFSPRRHEFAVGGWVLDAGAYEGLAERRRASLPPGASLDTTFFPAYRARIVAGAAR